VPILQAFPIFGTYAADEWLWCLSLSPAYMSFGLLIDANMTFFMLFGAVLGYGLLSPLAKSMGWAPGPTGDWANGSQGWILWVALGLILGDTTVLIISMIGRMILRAQSRPVARADLVQDVHRRQSSQDPSSREVGRGVTAEERNRDEDAYWQERMPFLHTPEVVEVSAMSKDYDNSMPSAKATSTWILLSVALCAATLWVLFGRQLPMVAVAIPIVISWPLSFVNIRAWGETGQGAITSLSKWQILKHPQLLLYFVT
jgi:hypothetical protein